MLFEKINGFEFIANQLREFGNVTYHSRLESIKWYCINEKVFGSWAEERPYSSHIIDKYMDDVTLTKEVWSKALHEQVNQKMFFHSSGFFESPSNVAPPDKVGKKRR